MVNELLDNTSYKVLKELYKKNQCSFSAIEQITKHEESQSPSKYIRFLISNHLIQQWFSDEITEDSPKENKLIGYEITLEGNALIEQRRREKWNFWVPYAITTFIALLSLIGTFLNHGNTVQCFCCNLK